MISHATIYVIAALATAGVILRPFGWPEAIWAVAGATVLLAMRLITPSDALRGIANGTDVYLFLAGMMLLAEIARIGGLFDWLAAHAAKSAHGSADRLFLLIYAVGTIVTIFLSNDATAVVLTPAVAAAVRTAKSANPLPYLLICAFIANAASFVLPISNPANLVIYHSQMPPLVAWLARFTLPSVLSIGVTFVALRWTQRKALAQEIAATVAVPTLSRGGQTAAVGIAATAIALMVSSVYGIKLGLPTAAAGTVTAIVVLGRERTSFGTAIKDISWGILPLVAGLFVLVQALQKTGLIETIATAIGHWSQHSPTTTAYAVGVATALASNLANNLPVGLVAGIALQSANVPTHITSAALIGTDLGPNLSVTGSLATILWLGALRREGFAVNAWTFLKIGGLVMPAALALALASQIR